MFRARLDRLYLAYLRMVLRSPRTFFAFRLGLCGGVAAVAIDLDHITLFFGHSNGRVAHAPLLVLAGLVGGYCLARLGGLVYRVVLRRRKMLNTCARRNCPTCGGPDES